MLNNYHDEPAVRAEAMAIADDLGISRSMIAWLLRIFDASRVFDELAELQRELNNEYCHDEKEMGFT